MDTLRILDILGFVVGLVYLFLEYKASIWLWLAGVIMPLIDIFLYFKAGLYADFALAIYYVIAAVYGYLVWRKGKKKEELPVTHFKTSAILPAVLVGLGLWVLIWWILSTFTNSTVPVTDAFTTALSIVAMWTLARKYAEHWLMWLVVDAVCTVLYVYKGIPFKACIYGLYTAFAVLGYRKWLKMMDKDRLLDT